MTMALVAAMSSGLEQEVKDQFFKTLTVNSLIVYRNGDDSKLTTNETEIVARSPYVTSVSARMYGLYAVSNSVNTTTKSIDTL